MGISQPYEQWTGSWDHGLFWRFGERTGGKEENKTLQTESRFSPPSTRIKGLAGQVARLPSCDGDMDNYFEDFGDTTSSQVFCSLACGGLSWLWLRIAAPVSASWGKTRHVLKVSEDSFIASLLSLVFHSSATCLVLIATLRSLIVPGDTCMRLGAQLRDVRIDKNTEYAILLRFLFSDLISSVAVYHRTRSHRSGPPVSCPRFDPTFCELLLRADPHFGITLWYCGVVLLVGCEGECWRDYP